jgi:predicted DNA-binding transcriptional regulator AlpA
VFFEENILRFMSSNQQIKKVCLHEPCSKIFTAQKVTTKFCSLDCARRDYKLQEKKRKLQQVQVETSARMEKIREDILGPKNPEQDSDIPPELINISTLHKITSLSERTIYRLMKDPEFPRQKILSNLRFDKNDVLAYLKKKFGSQ